MEVIKITEDWGCCMEPERSVEKMGNYENTTQIVETIKKEIKNIIKELSDIRSKKHSEDYGYEERIIEIDGEGVDNDEDTLNILNNLDKNDLEKYQSYTIQIQNNDRYSSITEISYNIITTKSYAWFCGTILYVLVNYPDFDR